jgi:hypothetical protein
MECLPAMFAINTNLNYCRLWNACLPCLQSQLLKTGGDFHHQWRDIEIAQKIVDCQNKPTDLTIHWKALEEHFLMVPFIFHSEILS